MNLGFVKFIVGWRRISEKHSLSCADFLQLRLSDKGSIIANQFDFKLKRLLAYEAFKRSEPLRGRVKYGRFLSEMDFIVLDILNYEKGFIESGNRIHQILNYHMIKSNQTLINQGPKL